MTDEQDAETRGVDVEVRRARAEDREAVLAFCAHTWGDDGDHGDYIEEAWDTWLADARGALLVGVVAGQPVALQHIALVSDDEAWHEGMRVDPNYRRQGIGRVMVSRGLVTARDLGATVSRLMTDADNLASQGLVERFGFTRVAELERYRAPAATTSPDMPSLSTPGPDDFERIWAWLEQSNLAPLTGGLEVTEWHAEALTEPLLRGYLAAGQVALLEEWGTIGALAVAAPDTAKYARARTFEARYVDGLTDAIGRLAYALRAKAQAQGYANITLWLPASLILHDAMDGAGYEHDDGTYLIYARDL